MSQSLTHEVHLETKMPTEAQILKERDAKEVARVKAEIAEANAKATAAREEIVRLARVQEELESTEKEIAVILAKRDAQVAAAAAHVRGLGYEGVKLNATRAEFGEALDRATRLAGELGRVPSVTSRAIDMTGVQLMHAVNSAAQGHPLSYRGQVTINLADLLTAMEIR